MFCNLATLVLKTLALDYFSLTSTLPNAIPSMNNDLSQFPVTDRSSFVTFIDALLEDFHENPETWSHKTVPDFLSALSSYAEDIQGYYDNQRLKIDADQPSWRVFADILKAATLYEE